MAVATSDDLQCAAKSDWMTRYKLFEVMEIETFDTPEDSELSMNRTV
jgi:hypothetical protein